MNFTILRFDSIDSTNAEALKQARRGADEGLYIVAQQQTAGRGRHGRAWISPRNAGLYLSVVLRPKIDAKYLPLITLASGIAVYETLAGLGLKPDIKWPNDILINEKKIAGILAETTETEMGLAVTVGIGLNLSSRNFPSTIASTATSIEAEIGRLVASSELEESVTRFFGHFYETVTAGDGQQKILREWRRRSSYFKGKSVRVTLENETIIGITDGLEPNGALRVRKDDGDVAIVHAGDVERLRST